MKTFARHDADGWVLGVYTQESADGIPEPCAEVPELAAWPARPGPNHQARLQGGAITWQDPRTAAAKAAEARQQRDERLAATDWRVTRALEQGGPLPVAWAAYRQALRDLTAQPGFPHSITWPDRPES